jgi:histidine triad (HIT) family protein
VAVATGGQVKHMGDREGCIFCRIIEGKAPAYVIDENDEVIVFLSLENHPLVVPKEHVPDIYAMSSDMGAHVMEETIKVARAVKKALQCDGIYLTQSNEPAAGQDVFHFHLHVYPCWEGKEKKAISRFVSSVTDPENVTDEMKVAMMEKIREIVANH